MVQKLPVAANMRVHLALLLFTSLLLAEQWNDIVLVAAANSSRVALPGCPQDCGNGVLIPYPFGIGKNCYLDEQLELECKGNKPYFRDYEMVDISLPTREVRVLIPTTRMCNRQDYAALDLSGPSLSFSHTMNKLTVVGCDTLGTMQVYKGYKRLALGCLATCENSTDSLVADGICSGFGCCQTSIPRDRRYLVLENINPKNATGTQNLGAGPNDIIILDKDASRSCAYVFLVEAANYTFKKSHLSWTENQIFPVVLDFGIYDDYKEKTTLTFKAKTCELARTNTSTYACKGSQSICIDLPNDAGYFCNCSTGHRGNPYLEDGCHDIDECQQDPFTPLCDGICVNTPGSYYCKPRPSSRMNLTTGIIIGVSSGLGGLIFFIIATFIYKRICAKKLKLEKERFFQYNFNLLRQQHQLNSGCNESIIEKIKIFPLKVIQKATDNFDSTRIVGQGGHGTVYKGLLDLKVVAIKRPKMLVQDEIIEFLNEIILLSQISHRNVVQLIGCCLETEVPLLVYEFISSGTLSDHLHINNGESYLSWEDRLRIATEISAGLSYLHTAANVFILHRDIKSANILLDERLMAKISDFGASKAIEVEQTHLTTNVQGTLGYMDPEYIHTGQLTNKTDVYSLGVILVELLTGQRPTSTLRSQPEKNLISYFKEALLENKLLEMVDAFLVADANVEEVHIVSKLAVDCLSMRGKDRPTMKDVEMKLEGLMKGKKKRNIDDITMKNDKNEIFTSETSILWSNGNTRDESTIQLNIEECAMPLNAFQR